MKLKGGEMGMTAREMKETLDTCISCTDKPCPKDCKMYKECIESVHENLFYEVMCKARDTIDEMLKEQEPRELTKEEWDAWKKDKKRDPICMVWYGDTTPMWILKPIDINEILYLTGKIKLFNGKPSKEQVKWE